MEESLPIKRDLRRIDELRSFVERPESLAELSDAEAQALIDDCLARLHRLRPGGRSTSLLGLSIFLWSLHERWPRIKLEIEHCLALAFRIAIDPSFIHPEWGVILAGVLLARYVERLPVDARDEVVQESRLRLRDLEDRPRVPNVVRSTASALIESFDAGFPEGVDPVFRCCLRDWPSTEGIRDIPDQRLSEIIADIARLLPATLNERELRLYRLFLERRGEWGIFELPSFS